MSGKKILVLSISLLVVSVIAFCAWMSRSIVHRQAAINGVVHPHAESNAGAQPTAVAVSGAVAVVASSISTATYRNDRFNFAVDYPDKLLVAGRESDNGDGLRFAPKAGDADIRAYGSYNALLQSPAEMLQFNTNEDCAKDKITYRVSKPTLVAYSCASPTGRIVYAKVIIRDDTLATVRFDYDPREQARWAPVIKQMADSLYLGMGPTEQAR